MPLCDNNGRLLLELEGEISGVEGYEPWTLLGLSSKNKFLRFAWRHMVEKLLNHVLMPILNTMVSIARVMAPRRPTLRASSLAVYDGFRSQLQYLIGILDLKFPVVDKKEPPAEMVRKCDHVDSEGKGTIKRYGNAYGRYQSCTQCGLRWKWNGQVWEENVKKAKPSTSVMKSEMKAEVKDEWEPHENIFRGCLTPFVMEARARGAASGESWSLSPASSSAVNPQMSSQRPSSRTAAKTQAAPAPKVRPPPDMPRWVYEHGRSPAYRQGWDHGETAARVKRESSTSHDEEVAPPSTLQGRPARNPVPLPSKPTPSAAPGQFHSPASEPSPAADPTPSAPPPADARRPPVDVIMINSTDEEDVY